MNTVIPLNELSNLMTLEANTTYYFDASISRSNDMVEEAIHLQRRFKTGESELFFNIITIHVNLEILESNFYCSVKFSFKNSA